MQQALSVEQVKAEAVLAKIDDLLLKIGKAFSVVAALLIEAKRGAYWQVRGYHSESDWIRATFAQSRSEYYALLGMGERLLPFMTPKTLAEIGRCNAESLVKVVRHLGACPDDWIERARVTPYRDFQQEVRSFLGVSSKREDEEPSDYITFRLFGDQQLTVREALLIAGFEAGADRGYGYLLELVCADFLSGHTEDGLGRLAGRNGLIFPVCESLLRQADWRTDPTFRQRLVALVASLLTEISDTEQRETQTHDAPEAEPNPA